MSSGHHDTTHAIMTPLIITYHIKIYIWQMGAANTLLSETCGKVWDQVPDLPPLKFDTSTLNRGFVNFCVIVGVITIAKSLLTVSKGTLTVLKHLKMPSSEYLLTKYGCQSYVLIFDAFDNFDYCIFFHQAGFNLILVDVDEEKVKFVKDYLLSLDLFQSWETLERKFAAKFQKIHFEEKAKKPSIESAVFDWNKDAANQNVYNQLKNQWQKCDISIIVLPKVIEPKEESDLELTSQQKLPPIQHLYLVARYFTPQLIPRASKSALIFSSVQNPNQVTSGHGITKGLRSAAEGFVRILGYELKNQGVDVVVARGSVNSAIKGLGNTLVTY